MKKNFAILIFALLALGFIQISMAAAESGSDSDNSEDDIDDSTNTIAKDIREARMDSRIEVKREMKDGKIKEEIKERVKNGTMEFRQEVRQEIKDLAQDEKERRMIEFKTRLASNNGSITIEKMKIRISNLNAEQKEIVAGKINAQTGLNLTAEDVDGNGTALKAVLSNGRYADIKIMPDAAARVAVERMKAKCEERNCSVELREVAEGKNRTRAVYFVRTEKEARTFFIFKTKMKVDAEVDAETGEIINSHKPWWAFLAREKAETDSLDVESNTTEDVTSTMLASDENVTSVIVSNDSELAAV